jgi:hypothetical protein
VGAAVLAAPAPAGAAGPRVEARIIDRSGDVVGPRTVRVDQVRFRSSGRSCRLRSGSPVGVLRELGARFRARGACDSVYVFQVGGDRGTGAQGWVYKVGRRLPSVSASDPSARLRTGQRVTWFWCVRAGNCQRTLEVVPEARTVAPGGSLRVRVRAYDDFGRGRNQGGALVSLGTSTAVTAADGTATLTAPADPGRVTLLAERDGLVPSFAERISVG